MLPACCCAWQNMHTACAFRHLLATHLCSVCHSWLLEATTQPSFRGPHLLFHSGWHCQNPLLSFILVTLPVASVLDVVHIHFQTRELRSCFFLPLSPLRAPVCSCRPAPSLCVSFHINAGRCRALGNQISVGTSILFVCKKSNMAFRYALSGRRQSKRYHSDYRSLPIFSA